MSPRWCIPVFLLAAELAACTSIATPTPAQPGPTSAATPAAPGLVLTTTPEPHGTRPVATPVPSGTAPAGQLASTPTPNSAVSPALTPPKGLAPERTRRLPATPTATPASSVATSFVPAPDRDLYGLAVGLKRAREEDLRRVVNPDPVSYAQGREDTFWLVDLSGLTVYQSRFVLRLVSPHAYWYVEENQTIRQKDIERAAAGYEEQVHPRVTAAFGEEWSPGVDNDPHLNILNGRLRGVAGYYSSSDEYPLGVVPFSNEREIIYINSSIIPMGSPDYLETLAHELQHAAHWNADASEETWINEGLSELAATIAGFDQATIYRFLQSGPTSLVQWPLLPFGAGRNYGAASLFMHYLADHYGKNNDLRPLLNEQEDGIAGVNAYLRSAGYSATFPDVFRDWAVANLLDERQGVYGYSDLEVQVGVSKAYDGIIEYSSEIPQYAVEYVELSLLEGPLRLRFDGPAENRLLPVDVDSRGCWWSNSGDSIDSTLTRSVDLTGLDRATLVYQVWYELEEKWDYAYLEVSVDDGRTWDILETPNTTAENPIGNSFGEGYTGNSLGWLDESVDLGAYSGREVLLRFQYVTDDAVNGAGLCVRGVSVPEAGLVEITNGWRAEGFVLTSNRVKQDYIVQVIQMAGENQVTVVPLDGANSGEIVIPAPQDLDRLVVVVAALAPGTQQWAPYTLSIGPA